MEHVSTVIRSGYFHLRNIALARRNLTKAATKSLTQALVLTRLDYCNSLLLGISDELLNKLQVLQNSAARLVCQTSKREHMTPVLHELHWLPVRARIDFKVLHLVFRCLQGTAPLYLCDLIQSYMPTRCLRSADQNLLTEQSFRSSTFGGRAFSRAAPRLWNRFFKSSNIDHEDSFEFKRFLKTGLFRHYYESSQGERI